MFILILSLIVKCDQKPATVVDFPPALVYLKLFTQTLLLSKKGSMVAS